MILHCEVQRDNHPHFILEYNSFYALIFYNIVYNHLQGIIKYLILTKRTPIIDIGPNTTADMVNADCDTIFHGHGVCNYC